MGCNGGDATVPQADSSDGPFEWAADSTLCGEVVAGSGTCPVEIGQEVRIGTIVAERIACDNDTWETGSDPDWVTWWDELVASAPILPDRHFEAALPVGEFAAVTSWGQCYGCVAAKVDGISCTTVTIQMYEEDTLD